VSTRLTLVPDEGIVVAALCNYRHDLPQEITREILATLIPEKSQQIRIAPPHQPNRQPPAPGLPAELVGYWAGEVETYAGRRRLELWAHADGDVHTRLNGGLITLLNRSRFANGRLTGVFQGRLATPDTDRLPYHLQLGLQRNEDFLRGPVTATSLPPATGGFTLGHWAELKREDPDPHLAALFDGHSLAGWRIPNEFDFARHGKVEVIDGTLVLGEGNPATGVNLDGNPPRYDYEISLDAKRVAGSDFFCGMTFPVGDRYLTLIVGGWGGGVIGLSNLDGMSAVENETTSYKEFQLDRWYHIRLRVTRDRVAAWIDGEPVVDVGIADRQLSIWWEVEPSRPLGIATWYTRAALRRIHLKRLTGVESP
jgi:hypothetical protein